MASFFMMFMGCTTAPQIKLTESKPAPVWMTSTPQDTDKCFYRGTYVGAETLKEGEENARQHAYRQVAKFLKSGEMHCISDQTAKTNVDGSLSPLPIPATVIQNVKMIDSYHKIMTRVDEHSTLKKIEVSVLVSYPKKEAVLEQKRQQEVMQSQIVEACNILKSGMLEHENGEYYQAVLSSRKALEILTTVQGIPSNVPNDVEHCQKLELQLRTLKKESMEKLKSVGVWLQETPIGGNQITSLLETSMKSILKKRGFTVISSSTPKGLSAIPLFFSAWEGGSKVLKLLSNQGVHALIVGQASTEFHSMAMEQYFFEVQGELKVFETSSGAMITSIPLNARDYHRDKSTAKRHALIGAGHKAGELLVEKFLFEEP